MKRRLVLLAIAFALAGCAEEDKKLDPIIVGGKSTTEQRIFVEALAHLIEKQEYPVIRKPDLGGTAELDAAARAGKVDVYIEYSNDALVSVVRVANAGQMIQQGLGAVMPKVKAVYDAVGLVWCEPIGEDNPVGLVVRGNTAAVGVGEAVSSARNWRAAFSFEYQQRADGYPAMQRAYGFQAGEVKTLDASALYHALADHQVDVVNGYASDGSIPRLGLRVLTDDKKAAGSNVAVPIYRRGALQKFPGLPNVLAKMNQATTTERVRAWNEQVDSGAKTAQEAGVEMAESMSLF
jgi:glycine betaine/choline ABC-type transport system substrate-binding protein